MSELPKPSSWAHSFVVACISLFVGAVALQLAVEVLRGIAAILVTSGLILVLVAVIITLRRHRNRPESW